MFLFFVCVCVYKMHNFFFFSLSILLMNYRDKLSQFELLYYNVYTCLLIFCLSVCEIYQKARRLYPNP